MMKDEGAVRSPNQFGGLRRCRGRWDFHPCDDVVHDVHAFRCDAVRGDGVSVFQGATAGRSAPPRSGHGPHECGHLWEREERSVSPAVHRVAILVYDGVKLLDVAGPAEVFGEANRLGADYRISLVSTTGADVASSIGIRVTVDGGPS